MNTHTIVADVHQNVLKICKDVGSQNPMVSDTCFLASPNNTDHRSDSKQVSNLDHGEIQHLTFV